MMKRKAPGKPGSSAPAVRASGGSSFDFDAIRELARIAAEFDLAEVEAEPSGRIRVSRLSATAPVFAAPAHAPGARSMPSAPVSLVPPPAAEPADAGLAVVSPFVGTFYRSPSPDAAPFVEVGQTVRKGQVVCIVEAMKLMNEIEAEHDGKVVEILAKNGDHVEYGQPLVRLGKA